MRPGFSNYPYTKEYLCIYLTSSTYLETSVRHKHTPTALLQSLCWKVIANQGFGSILSSSRFSKDFKTSVCHDKSIFFSVHWKPGDLMLASNKWMYICLNPTVLNTPTPWQKNPKAAYLTEGLPQPSAQHSTARHPHGPAPSPHCGILLDPVHSLQLRAPKSSGCRDALVTLMLSSRGCGGINFTFLCSTVSV